MRISDWSSDVCSSDLKATQQSRAWVAALDCFAPLAMTDYARTDTKVLILFGDPHLQPVERVAERNLARQPRIFVAIARRIERSEEHTSELQSLMRISYAVFCLKKKKNITTNINNKNTS